jgi:hypothetical protein
MGYAIKGMGCREAMVVTDPRMEISTVAREDCTAEVHNPTHGLAP